MNFLVAANCVAVALLCQQGGRPILAGLNAIFAVLNLACGIYNIFA